MTHSSILYEKEVGAGLVANTVRPIFLPKASHIKHQIEKKEQKKKQLVPWKSTAGKVTDGHAAGFHPQTQ